MPQTDDDRTPPTDGDDLPGVDRLPDVAEPEDLLTDGPDDEDADDEDADDDRPEHTLRVGVAVREQAADVHALLLRAFAEQGHLDPPTGVAGESAEDIAVAIDSGQTIVAVLDGRLVGTVRYVVTPDSVYLGRLAVEPDVRREGIASALIEWCATVLLPAEDRRALDVEVRASLPGNVRLFQSLGFARLGVYPHPRNAKAKVVKFRWRAPATGWPPTDPR